MANIASVLSILVEANTGTATTKLAAFDRQLESTRAKTRTALEAKLGANFNSTAFRAYDEQLTRVQRRVADRSAFKAALGGEFNASAFRAYERALDTAAVKTKEVAVEQKGLGAAMSETRGKMLGVATAVTGVTFGLGEIATKSVEAATNFQRSMEMIHTQAGATQKQVEQLSASVLDMARSLGTAPNELATGLYHIVSSMNSVLPAAQRNRKEMEALKIAAEGAKVGNANLEDVTNALGATIASGLPGVQNYQKAMGMLNATVGAGDMRMQDLADAFGTGLLGPMKQFGVSLQDISAALAVFGDNNIRGQDAATKLNSAIRIMAAPSHAAAKALAEIGLSSTTLADDIRHGGLVKAFVDLKQHLVDSGKNATQQAQVISAAFGGRQSLGVQLLLGQIDRLKSKYDEVGKGAHTFGGAWAATQKTIGFQTDQLRASIETLMIKLGNVLAPVVGFLNKIVLAFTKFVIQMQKGTGFGGQVARVLKTIFTDIKDGYNWLVRFAGGTKNLAIALGIVLGLFVAWSTAMAAITIISNPLVLIFIALAAAAILIVKNWKPIKAFFIDLFNSVKAAAEPVVQWLENAWTNTANAVVTAWQAVASALGGVFAQLQSIFGPVIDAIVQGVQSILPAVGPAFDTLTGIFQTLYDAMTPVRDFLVGQLVTAFQVAQTVIGGAMTQIGNVVSAGWTIARNAFTTALSLIHTVMNTIAGVIRGAFQVIKGLLEVFSGLFTLDFSKMWQGIKDIFSGALKAVVAIVTGEWGALKAAGRFIMEGLSEGFKLAWATLKTLVSTILQSFLTIIKGVWNSMFNAGKYILGGVEAGFKAAVNGILGVIVGFLNDIIDLINHIPGVSIGKVTAPKLAQGGIVTASGHAMGAKVMAPGYFAGEEAPQHPEFILATNPRYRQRNLQLFQQAGKMLDVPGFASGGIFGYLENLWTGAGGPVGVENIAAAIAMAESSGNPRAYNASGASGLWQILGQLVPGNIFDPKINAENAVAKYRQAGNSFSPWVTYTNGAYKAFLGGGGGGGGGILGAIGGLFSGVLGSLVNAASGGLSAILGVLPSPPKLPGWIAGLPGYVLDKVGNWIKDQVGGLLGGGGGSTLATGIAHTTMFDSHPIADWIYPIISWARTHGWSGYVTSGYRTPAQQLAAAQSYGLEHYGPAGPLGSNHIRTNYPGGAIDVTQAAQLAAVLQGYPGHPTLVWGGPVIGDYVHFSATGHRTGGVYGKLAGAFGKGGMVAASSPTMAIFGENGPETAVFIPGYAAGGRHGLGVVGGASPGAIPPVPYVPPHVASVPSRVHHAAATAIQLLTGEPAVPVLGGSTPATQAGAAALAGNIGGLNTAISGLEHTYSIFDQYFNLNPITLLNDDGTVNQTAVNQRLGQIDRLIDLRQRIFDSWGWMVALTQRLADSYRYILKELRKQLASVSTRGLKGNALKWAQGLQKKYSGDISTISGKLSSTLGDIATYGDSRDAAWISLLQDQSTRAGIAGTQPNLPATTGGGGGGGTTTVDPRVALLTQLLQTANLTTAVSQAQYRVLQTFPPYGGSFATGGVVPGPIGAARTIIAHGGESIGGGGAEVHLHFTPGTEWLRDFVQVEIRQSGRRDSRYASRVLPGAR